MSFPLAWEDLDDVVPTDFTIRNAVEQLDRAGPWMEGLSPQRLPADLLEEGHQIPTPRVQAMHEGKRRKRAREREQAEAGD